MLKRLLPRSLFGRAIVIVVTPVVLIQFIVAFIFFDRHLDSVTGRLARSVANDITYIITNIAREDSPARQVEILALASRQLNLNFLLIDGEVLNKSPQPSRLLLTETTLYRAMDDGLSAPFTIEHWPQSKAYVIRVGLGVGVLQVLVPHNRLIGSSSNLLVFWTVGSSLLFLTIAIVFLRNQVRPIRRLAEAADRFGKGQDVDEFKPAGASEVRQAGTAFLQMKDRIERQIRQRTEMLAGVSHDLRTPLTRMKLVLAMQDDSADAAEMKTDVDDMEKMIEGYLAFARGADGEATVPTDLGDLLTDITADARRKGASVTLQTAGNLEAHIRPQSLKRCLTNLLDNAQKYARHAFVMAERHNDRIDIVIDDDGPGIPTDRREEVFRPFFRLEASRNPGTGGVGLGLAIARDTVRSQGGDIVLEDAPQGGLRAVVQLPV